MLSVPPKVTDRAFARLTEIGAADQGKALRVGVKGGGCSGMSYVLGFDKKRDKDREFEIDGITVYMDQRHGLYLMGTEINYHDGLNARGFTFENPNATETCGCGASFAA